MFLPKSNPILISDVKSLKTPPTSVTRVEICIGGWGNESYDHIKSLINLSGTDLLQRYIKTLKY